MNPNQLTKQLGLFLGEPETESCRLLLEYLQTRFSPVPPWDLALLANLDRQARIIWRIKHSPAKFMRSLMKA